jgi:diguanylate cyclase (GGDEF)-like protein
VRKNIGVAGFLDILIGPFQQFTLYNRVFNAVTLSAAIVSGSMFVSDVLQDFGPTFYLFSLFATCAHSILYWIGRKKYFSQKLVWSYVFISCISIIYVWKVVGGIVGSASLLLVIGLAVTIPMLLFNKQLVASLAGVSSILILLFIIEWWYPEIVEQYADRYAGLMDLFSRTLFLGMGLSFVVWLFVQSYELQQRKINDLNESLSFVNLRLEERNAELDRMAMTDPLTGASNRRNFMVQATEELERSKRSGNPISFLMFDIDHFKAVNDRYGHDSGDEVLRRFTKHCLSHLRSIDRFARFGGEEFFALLIQTDQDEAKNVAERLRKSVEDMEVPANGGVIRITVSIGLTTTTDDSLSVEESIKRTDKALYEAKRMGRNRVAIL